MKLALIALILLAFYIDGGTVADCKGSETCLTSTGH